jgi:hypothetical protein
MNKEDRKKLYALIEQETRAEIMARLCPFYKHAQWMQGQYDAWEFRDQIRKLMFGTSDMIVLADRWGLPIRKHIEKPVTKLQLKFKLKGKQHGKSKT